MRHHRAAAVALDLATQAWSKSNRSCQGNEAANGVYHCGAREIVKVHSKRRQKVSHATHSHKKSVRPPGPVTNDWINKTGNGETVEQVANKSSAANHGAGSDGRAGIGKGKLEKPECQERHATGLISSRHILQEKPVVPDKSVAVAKHECETDSEEENAAETCIDDAFHQDVDGFARATEASLQHGEANLHTKDQERSDQGPNSIQRIDNVIALYFRIGGKDLTEADQIRKQGRNAEHQ